MNNPIVKPLDPEKVLECIKENSFGLQMTLDPDSYARVIDVMLLEQAINSGSLDASDAGWQPIETAPQDGFHIQLYRPDIQFVGYWAKAGWCMQGCKIIDPAPTHWMPLPVPPTEADSHE